MSSVILGIGDWAVSKIPADTIKTYALGSCVAVLIYDRALKIGGMIHVALPDSAVDPRKAEELPGYFADTGLPLMIEEMKRLGAVRRNVWVKLAGGAAVGEAGEYFDIGRRNILTIKKILWKSSLGPVAEDTGGSVSRTVAFTVESGEIVVSTPAGERRL